MIYRNGTTVRNAIMTVAELMCAAARTAPKARGTDTIETLILDGTEKDELTTRMREIGERLGKEFFIRDAGNLDAAPMLVLIGSNPAPRGLDCALCGVPDCETAARDDISCAIDITDLGIAVGSAASIAMDNRIDNRIMFSAGMAALELKMFSDSIKIGYGIGLSATGKSIFFDRPAINYS